MKNSDPLGDRMKLYESVEAKRHLMPLLPAMARLDGKCFHSFCRDLERPYDNGMSSLMVQVATDLVNETNACMAYTQSDEITLCWKADSFGSQIYFNGRIQKMVSILAALASVRFNLLLPEFLDGKSAGAMFDCRVWNVPSEEEAANSFLWREFDATKNSISMAARAYYSHNEVNGKNGVQKQEMLHKKGVNWNDYPSFFKRGTYIQKRRVVRKYTCDELEKLPPRHHAHTNPDLEIDRAEISSVEMPPFSEVVNRSAVIFDGATPVTDEIECRKMSGLGESIIDAMTDLHGSGLVSDIDMHEMRILCLPVDKNEEGV